MRKLVLMIGMMDAQSWSTRKWLWHRGISTLFTVSVFLQTACVRAGKKTDFLFLKIVEVMYSLDQRERESERERCSVLRPVRGTAISDSSDTEISQTSTL